LAEKGVSNLPLETLNQGGAERSRGEKTEKKIPVNWEKKNSFASRRRGVTMKDPGTTR